MRARQDSNLRPSLFVVLIPMFSDVRECQEIRLSKRHLSSPVHRCSLWFSFYCCPTVTIPLEGASRLSRRPTPFRPCSLFALFSRRGLFSKAHHLAYTSC